MSIKGYLTSYASLFGEDSSVAANIKHVQIPIFQRDYAQGRKDIRAEDIRRDFIDVLFDAIIGGTPVGLDFVYGEVEAGTFEPLDGQQRLTTLFLIHWYVASRARLLHSEGAWKDFTYETRPGARRFCQLLVEHDLPAGVHEPAEWIRDQPWFLYTWRNDPTIQSMLVMIDAIDTKARALSLDPAAAWGRLLDPASPAVSFYLLPLDNMGSAEDLYIKMNSRGKPLTKFEDFKAQFEQDIKHLARAKDFSHRIDGAWSDLMWTFHGGDNIVDDEFMRLFDYITQICELRDGQAPLGRIGPRARAIFGPTNPRADQHLDFLFSVFDVWCDGQHVKDLFSEVFSIDSVPRTSAYDARRVLLFGSANVNLFEQCCNAFDSQLERNRTFSMQESLLLYAVLMHLINNTEDFPRRARTLRNLLAASVQDEIRRQNLPALLKDVESVIVHDSLEGVTKLSSNQVQDELAKRSFLARHPELTEPLLRLEDHEFLRGTLSAFDLSADVFERRARAFEAAFADPKNYLGLTGALLATGDYQRRRRGTESWQFGTAGLENQSVWRTLFTEASSQELVQTREALGTFLDGVPAGAADVSGHLDAVMGAWLADRDQRQHFDWRYYLVKYPAMRGSLNDRTEGKTGIYWGIAGELGYSMCMLRTKQLNGHYRDPILLQVWKESGVGKAARDPWFSGDPASRRFLRLERSKVGLRSVPEGFELDGPEEESFGPQFLETCGALGVVPTDDPRYIYRLPQRAVAGAQVDIGDRVVAGAELLRRLVDAGL